MWIALTEDDLFSSINKHEEEIVREAMLVSGQSDPFGQVRDQVVALFRGAIRSGPGNRLDPDETLLPPSAIYHATAKLRFRLLTRFAADLIDDDRRTENKEAESWLKEVRRGHEKIEQPDDEPGEGNVQTIDVVQSNPHVTTRDTLAGL